MEMVVGACGGGRLAVVEFTDGKTVSFMGNLQFRDDPTTPTHWFYSFHFGPFDYL